MRLISLCGSCSTVPEQNLPAAHGTPDPAAEFSWQSTCQPGGKLCLHLPVLLGVLISAGSHAALHMPGSLCELLRGGMRQRKLLIRHPGAVVPPQVWYYRLKDQCIKPDGSRRLVVDVGANFGWYSLFAAAMGCRCGASPAAPALMVN